MKEIDDCVRPGGYLATIEMPFWLRTQTPRIERRVVLIKSINALEKTYRFGVECALSMKRNGQQIVYTHEEKVDVKIGGLPMFFSTENFVPLYAKGVTDEEFDLLPEYIRQQVETEHYGVKFRLHDLVTLGDRSASNLGAEEVDHRVAMIDKDGTLYVWEAAKFPNELFPRQSLFRIELNGEIMHVNCMKDIPIVRNNRIPGR